MTHHVFTLTGVNAGRSPVSTLVPSGTGAGTGSCRPENSSGDQVAEDVLGTYEFSAARRDRHRVRTDSQHQQWQQNMNIIQIFSQYESNCLTEETAGIVSRPASPEKAKGHF